MISRFLCIKAEFPDTLWYFPWRAADGYLAKRVRKEESVAICKQAGDLTISKEPVKRKVACIAPPGTVTDGTLREECRNKLLVAAQIAGESFGVVVTNITRNDFSILEVESKETQPCAHCA